LPLYPYRCTQCGHRFEKIQSFSAEPVKVCPRCGGPVERVLTAPGLQFKGAGWYVNDYAPKSSGAAADSAPAESKSESKTEANPATSAKGGESGGTSKSDSSGTSAPSTTSRPAAPSASSSTTD
jgi:putative FmdB family regulatory protein